MGRSGLAIRTVAVMMPGDMGHAVGRALRSTGRRVITCLQGRSARTRALAAKAGILDVDDDVALVQQADVVLSILPPAWAVAMAERLAVAMRTAGTEPIYVDCNAISPATMRRIAEIISTNGGRCVDGGIIGGPPEPGASATRLYLSGGDAPALAGVLGDSALRDQGLELCGAGEEIGQASGLKMCYAALTKGLTALATESLVAAKVLGLDELLRAELQASQSALLARIERSVPGMPPKAGRWVGEMEEIAATFGAVGLPPELMQGAAAVYRLVSATELGDEVPEERKRGQTADEVATSVASYIEGLARW